MEGDGVGGMVLSCFCHFLPCWGNSISITFLVLCLYFYPTHGGLVWWIWHVLFTSSSLTLGSSPFHIELFSCTISALKSYLGCVCVGGGVQLFPPLETVTWLSIICNHLMVIFWSPLAMSSPHFSVCLELRWEGRVLFIWLSQDFEIGFRGQE